MPTRRVGLTGCCVVLRPHGCCGPTGVAGVACAVRRAGLLGVRVGGGLSALFVAPTDLRPPRGLPAREPSAPRASLGASARSPARPCRPRGGLQSVGVPVCCPARPRHRPRVPQLGSPTCCLLPRWCSGRRMARPPARLGGLTSFVAAPRSPPVPSGPSGALHTGAACRCVFPGRSHRRPRVPRPGLLHCAGLASSGYFPHS